MMKGTVQNQTGLSERGVILNPTKQIQFPSLLTTFEILCEVSIIEHKMIDAVIAEYLKIPFTEMNRITVSPQKKISLDASIARELEQLKLTPPPPLPQEVAPTALHAKHFFAQIQQNTGILKNNSLTYEFINQYTFSSHKIRYYPFNYNCYVTSLDYIDGFIPRPFAIPLPEFSLPSYPEEIFWRDNYETISVGQLEIKLVEKNGIPTFTNGEIWADYAFIAHSGKAHFEQLKGIHWLRGGLVIGFNRGSFGEYTLSDGLLNANFQIVGLHGRAKFMQNNGKNTIERFLYIGLNPEETSYYYLCDGYISGNIIVGLHGKGIFNQIDGSIQSRLLAVGCEAGNGKYLMRDGGIYSDWLTIGIGASYVEADHDINAPWATGSGQFTQEGGEINTAIASIGSKGSAGTFKLLKKGLLVSNICHIGNYMGSTGTFEQDGGINRTGALNIGLNGTGAYHLSEGELELRLLIVGNTPQSISTQNSPNGFFIQNGGSVEFQTPRNELSVFIGLDSGNGIYELHNGSLKTTILHIGNNGTGTFLQSGGTHTADYIELGTTSGTGSYVLEAGKLRAHIISVGIAGTGSFIHRSGSLFASYVTLGTTLNTHGTYGVSGGSFIAGNVVVGAQSGYGSFSIDSNRTHIIISHENNTVPQQGLFAFGKNAHFDAVPDSLIMIRNAAVVINGSAPENLTGLNNVTFAADRGHSFIEAAGKDFGASSAGFDTNFSVHTLHIYGDSSVSVEIGNTIINHPETTSPDVLYIDTVSLSDGVHLIITNTTVYCRNIHNEGGTITGLIVPIDTSR